MIYRQRFDLSIGYDVIFTQHLFNPENTDLCQAFEDTGRILFFLDSGVRDADPSIIDKIETWCKIHKNQVELAAPVEIVTGGEEIKNSIEILDKVGHLMQKVGFDRHSSAVIIGGGAVIDAVGFAASVTHRGIRQVRIPTTVLSQNDSAMGVKNGINRFGLKNFYGTFSPPAAVVIDPFFLTTLTKRDWVSGVSEAFKVAIIKDLDFLEYLFENGEALQQRDLEVMAIVVKRCAIIHLEHIAGGGDPFETGSSRPLDFGHWAAHRLESLTSNRLSHGAAVAVGIAMDLICAQELDLVDPLEVDKVFLAMESTGLSLWDEALESKDSSGKLEILTGLEQFQEHLGGRLTLAMPCGLGQLTEINRLPKELIIKAVNKLRSRNDKRKHLT